MKEQRVYSEDGSGWYSIYQAADIEFMDPVKYYQESFIRMNISMMRDVLLTQELDIPIHYIESFIKDNSLQHWQEKETEITNTLVSGNLLQILQSTSKKEQVKLLNGLTITPDQLIAFIFKASKDFGYSFSQYTAEHHRNGLDVSKLPRVIEIKDDTVNKVGATPYTDGQLKQAIEQRKVVVSKFLDRGTEWHCFFITYESIKGNENWNGGQPHYHYISDKFGISRTRVVEELKSRKYHLGNLPHIELHDYRPNEKI